MTAAQEMENYGRRLMDSLYAEFRNDKEWDLIPSLMVVIGWAMLRKYGNDRERILKMVDAYMGRYDELMKAKAGKAN